MIIPCPNCKAQINAKPPKPGRYTPKCPKCGNQFVMIVPADANATVQIKSMPKEPTPQRGTVPFPPPKPSSSPEVTGEFTDPDADPNTTTGPTAPNVTGASGPRNELDATAAQPSSSSDVAGPDEVTEATGLYIPKNKDADTERTAALPQESGSNIDATTDHGADAPKPQKPAKRKGTGQQALPDQLGGYELVKQLGAGGMGAVYLARQVSLDRSVALKVMHANWAKDPIFLARFSREAYAAAQLNHHNVVQIYDLGADAGVNFFSMEFVEGKSLGDLLKKSGKIEPAVAVGYILQAARGLKYAHDRGMIHRDIKPDNLMLNTEGIVKVADLGLVKTRGMSAADDQASAEPRVGGAKVQTVAADVTHVGTAMGSPSYMAPEQCRDASTVDHRADIYSLGCSLYTMLSGRTVFQGKTAIEMIQKHLNDPPPPLYTVAKDVPRTLSDIVAKTLAKDPAHRYQSMEEFVAAVKTWQDEQTAGPPKPTEEQIAAFEHLTAKVTSPSGTGLAVAVAAVGLVVGLGLLFVSPMVGGAVLVGVVAAVVSGFLATGMFTDSYLCRKARECAFGTRIIDWITVGVAAVLFLAALYLAGLIVGGLVGLVLGVGAGFGYGFVVARSAQTKRVELKGEFDKILRRLRLAGMDEDGVRQFVVTVSGDKADSAYELLFGYEARKQARPAGTGLRESLIRRLEGIIEARQQAKAKRHLQALERNRLEAEGVSAADAKAQAEDAADDLVEQAAELRAANTDKTKKVNVRAVLTRYDKAKLQQLKRPRKPAAVVLMNKLVGAIFDPRLRVVLGALLIVGGLLWAKQNAAELSQVEAAATQATGADSTSQAKAQAGNVLDAFLKAEKGLKPLSVSFLPEAVTNLFDSVNSLVAGVLLILSAFLGSGLSVLLATVGAVIVLAGHKLGLPIPEVGPLKPNHVALIAGIVVMGLVLIFLRRR